MTSGRSRIRRIPASTYRVQMTPQFGFAAAREIVPYLSRLGITTLYCSPILTAHPGSTHGYDVVDPLHLNPELGGRAEFDSLALSLREHDMGLLLDIVPNHMAASVENPWWLDVLENGPSSQYADFFDIEWDPTGPGALENRVLLPVLGSPYGETLENGELRVESDDTGYHLRYYETELPLSTVSYALILGLRAVQIEQALGSQSDDWVAYSELLKDLDRVPSRVASKPSLIETRRKIRQRLEVELPRFRQIPAIRRELETAIDIVNGTPGDPRTFDILDQLVAGQAYRLSYWQLAREQINYRRFFDINDLVSMHVEDPNVFRATHERILELVGSGDVTGLRIDHVDGLWDPEIYLARLQDSLAKATGTTASHPAHYVVVEKILSTEERLPGHWPVAGTTGYEFIDVLNGLLVDPDGVKKLDEIYQRATGVTTSFAELVYQAKIRVLNESFAGHVQLLSVTLGKLADQDRHGRDLTFESMKEALIQVTATLPVYRTYINELGVHETDKYWIETATETSLTRRPDLRHTLAFLRRVLLLQVPAYASEDVWRSWLDFIMRWQQLTGPAMAKGHEDTALYQYNRLLSLNEVGGHPDSLGTSIDSWHMHNERMSVDWPHSLIATSTHDTKRSEDARARIAVISEMPDEWARRFALWQELNAGRRPVRNGMPIPDANVELLIYQTMLGSWPNQQDLVDEFVERITAYLIKAAREAKTYTSWIDVDSVYETALADFVGAICDPKISPEFLENFGELQRLISRAGAMNSLSQTLLKLTAPGVPDTYQGTEFWDYSMVDPDNRRAVDFRSRSDALERLDLQTPWGADRLANLSERWQDGHIKLYLVHRVLQLRNKHPEIFTHGDYLPCPVVGPFSEHIVAYARRRGSQTAIVVAPRLVLDFVRHESGLNLAEHWDGTYVEVPAGVTGPFTNVLSQRDVTLRVFGDETRLLVDDVLAHFPCGLLTNTT